MILYVVTCSEGPWPVDRYEYLAGVFTDRERAFAVRDAEYAKETVWASVVEVPLDVEGYYEGVEEP